MRLLRFFPFLLIVLLVAAAALISVYDHNAANPDDLRFDPAEGYEALAEPIAPPELGVCIHELDDVQALDAARAAGFTFARTDLWWEGVEQNGAFTFERFLPFQDLIEERGMWTLWILDYGHEDHGGRAFNRPEQIAAFGRYAEESARRFAGRSVVFEVWNEPDVEHHNFLSPRTFAALINASVEGAHRADPNARVVTGGLSWTDAFYFTPMIAAFEGRRPNVEALGMHLYRNEAPEEAIADMARMRAIAAPLFGQDAVWWNTEWGFNSAYDYGMNESAGAADPENRRFHGVLAARIALTAWLAGMDKSVWYVARDGSADPFDGGLNMGLVTHDGREKPALRAFRQFSAAARGRMLAGHYGGLPAGVRAIRLEGVGAPVVVIWAQGEDFETRLVTPPRRIAAAHDVEGRELPLDWQNGGYAFTLSERGGPIYLTLRE